MAIVTRNRQPFGEGGQAVIYPGEATTVGFRLTDLNGVVQSYAGRTFGLQIYLDGGTNKINVNGTLTAHADGSYIECVLTEDETAVLVAGSLHGWGFVEYTDEGPSPICGGTVKVAAGPTAAQASGTPGVGTTGITLYTLRTDSEIVTVEYLGAPGAGVVAGGTDGQFLVKDGASDYSTEWVTLGITHVSGLSATLSTLTSADVSLTSRVSTEEVTRGAADTSLTTRLSAEEAARGAGDTSLTSRISTVETGYLPLAGGVMADVLAVVAGTAALPGLAVAGDLNTGLFSPAGDTLAVSTGGVERLRIDSLGNAGFGVTAPSAVYRMHIRTPYGATGGAILIDNEADEDLRYSITIKAGSTTQGRRYIYFREYNQDAGWLMGSNQANDFILFAEGGHRFIGGGGVNADTQINASGTGTVKINVGGSVGGGTGGLALYSGDENQTRWFTSESAGTFAWGGLPFQAKSPNGSDYIEMKCENGLARITSDTKVTMRGDNTDTLTLSGGNVGIGTTTPAVKLDVVGQASIGVAGGHTTDYGLTINSGSFNGSDGYISFKVGASAVEYGRINVNQDGLLKITGTAGIVFRPNASVTPPSNGDVSIELTNNTTVTIKARGSDGTVRSVALTLA